MPELHPTFISNMSALLGDELGDFLRALDAPYAAALRVNPLRQGSAQAAAPFVSAPVSWAEHGFYIKPGTRPGAGLAHFTGAFYIQEASAMLPAALLDAQPCERILDLCAAPGGKSSQIAAAMAGEGVLVSNEPDTKRAKMLAGNLERLGVKNAVVVNEYPPKLAAKWPSFFDAIMVDAPCSGEGMFRREPDSRSEWEPASPEGCAKRQAGILDDAAKMLKPGGRMVYSTCTFNTHENENTVRAFIERHPEFSLITQRKLFPHRDNGDGQFAALLVKSDTSENTAFKREAPVSRKRDPAAEALAAFERQFISAPIPGTPVIWGEYLALIPNDAPPLDGIKTVSPGLTLAKILGKRLEPAHQLAMLETTLPSFELTTSDALKFASGEVVPCDQSGWLIAKWRDMPLGWGKASNGTLKNHVPKGIRRAMQGE